jgi:hypothetical protein
MYIFPQRQGKVISIKQKNLYLHTHAPTDALSLYALRISAMYTRGVIRVQYVPTVYVVHVFRIVLYIINNIHPICYLS